MDLINTIAQAATTQDVWDHLVNALAREGFDRINYGLTRYRVGKSIGDPDDTFFLSTHSIARVREFHESGLYLRTPEYRWVRENVGACSWGYLADLRARRVLPEDELKAMDQIGAKRARAGYTISFGPGQPRAKGAMGLAARKDRTQQEVDAQWARDGSCIHAICNMAHAKFAQLPLPVKRVALSTRQREVLEWIADGKSIKDVALLIGVSPSAVEKHLGRAREVLLVQTTAQAVAKLAFLNQIYLPGDDPV